MCDYFPLNVGKLWLGYHCKIWIWLWLIFCSIFHSMSGYTGVRINSDYQNY